MFGIEIIKPEQKKKFWLSGGDGLTQTKRLATKFESKEAASFAVNRIKKLYNLVDENIAIRDYQDIVKPKENKYGAIRTYYYESDGQLYETESIKTECIPFDSKFEATVYQMLRRKYSKREIVRQYPLQIKPETKRYRRLDWTVDFRLHTDDNHIVNIEAKGLTTATLREFKRNIQFLDCFNYAEFRRTIVVAPEAVKIDHNVRAMSLKEFRYRLGSGEI